MISSKTIQEINALAINQAKKTEVPSIFHLEYVNEVGQRLAKALHADKRIVALGTNLMDYMVGVALKENRIPEHKEMGKIEAETILEQYPEITKEEKENILWCILDHHGSDTFHSLESEICCNADCYKFLSVKGFIGGINAGRDQEFGDLIALYKKKVEEKWKALSLDVCKEELEQQYKDIKKIFEHLK